MRRWDEETASERECECMLTCGEVNLEAARPAAADAEAGFPLCAGESMDTVRWWCEDDAVDDCIVVVGRVGCGAMIVMAGGFALPLPISDGASGAGGG